MEELATPEAFERDPATVWAWYEWRRRAVSACVPNEGHAAIACFMHSREDVTLVTQNVDGLHQRALLPYLGSPEDRILELHGNLLRSRCSACDWVLGVCDESEPSDAGPLPRCPACAGLIRPDVVWFGEALDPMVLERAFAAAEVAEVCVVAGTSAIVQPAASIPVVAQGSGAAVIEVNTEITPLTAICEWSL